jgi:hypothetical protein
MRGSASVTRGGSSSRFACVPSATPARIDRTPRADARLTHSTASTAAAAADSRLVELPSGSRVHDLEQLLRSISLQATGSSQAQAQAQAQVQAQAQAQAQVLAHASSLAGCELFTASGERVARTSELSLIRGEPLVLMKLGHNQQQQSTLASRIVAAAAGASAGHGDAAAGAVMVYLRPSTSEDTIVAAAAAADEKRLVTLRAALATIRGEGGSGQLPEARARLASLQKRAERVALAKKGLVLTAFAAQFSGLFYLVYEVYSWDVMEPFTYFLSTAYALGAAVYFSVTKREASFRNLLEKHHPELVEAAAGLPTKKLGRRMRDLLAAHQHVADLEHQEARLAEAIAAVEARLGEEQTRLA